PTTAVSTATRFVMTLRTDNTALVGKYTCWIGCSASTSTLFAERVTGVAASRKSFRCSDAIAASSAFSCGCAVLFVIQITYSRAAPAIPGGEGERLCAGERKRSFSRYVRRARFMRQVIGRR